MSFLKPVVVINLHKNQLKELATGVILTLTGIIKINSKLYATNDNMFFIGELVNNFGAINLQLWVKHFMDSTEFDGEALSVKNLTHEGCNLHFPEPISFEIVGFNHTTNKVIIRITDSDKHPVSAPE
jgi:hypothetical protein